MRLVRTLVMLSAAWSICATATHADCAKFGSWALGNEGVVFDGTVLELKQRGDMQIAQMQVHRVFMGQLPPRIEIYHRPHMELDPIEAGQRYILPLTRNNPSGLGPIPRRPFVEPQDDPSLVWMSWGCGNMRRDTFKQDGRLRGFGPGWPPTR
jgi:hypothetical protein